MEALPVVKPSSFGSGFSRTWASTAIPSPSFGQGGGTGLGLTLIQVEKLLEPWELRGAHGG
jgi:hypothetical protein